MSESQTAYDLAYLLGYDRAPSAALALISQWARDRLRQPDLQGLTEAQKIIKLDASLDQRRRGYISDEYAIVTREILDSGQVVYGDEARQIAILRAAKARPWLWPAPTTPQIAREAAPPARIEHSPARQRQAFDEYMEPAAELLEAAEAKRAKLARQQPRTIERHEVRLRAQRMAREHSPELFADAATLRAMVREVLGRPTAPVEEVDAILVKHRTEIDALVRASARGDREATAAALSRARAAVRPKPKPKARERTGGAK